MIFWSAKKMTQRLFFSTLHPLSPVIFATATVVAFILLCNSWLDFHCYTQRETMPTQKSAQKWHCDLSRLLAQKITNSIHLCKPASLNRPIHYNSHIVRDKKPFHDRRLSENSVTMVKLCDKGKTFNGWRGKYRVFCWFSWKVLKRGIGFSHLSQIGFVNNDIPEKSNLGVRTVLSLLIQTQNRGQLFWNGA